MGSKYVGVRIKGGQINGGQKKREDEINEGIHQMFIH